MTAAIAATRRPYSTAEAPRSRARRLTLNRYASIEGVPFSSSEREARPGKCLNDTTVRRGGAVRIGRTVEPRSTPDSPEASGHARTRLASTQVQVCHFRQTAGNHGKRSSTTGGGLSRPRLPYETQSYCSHHCLCTITCTEFLVDVRDMRLGGRLADEEPARDLGDHEAVHEELEDLPLPGGELRSRGGVHAPLHRVREIAGGEGPRA